VRKNVTEKNEKNEENVTRAAKYHTIASTMTIIVYHFYKFWQHQAAKFDFTADLTGTGNRSEEAIK